MSARRWTVALAIACALAGTVAAPVARAAPEAAAPAAFPDRTERLVGLARVWAHVRYYHPYLAYKPIDWDAALVAAIPRVEAAADVAAYRAAIDGMLKTLGDPATHIVTPEEAAGSAAAAALGPQAMAVTDWLSTPSKDVLLIDLGRLTGGPLNFSYLMEAAAHVGNAAPAAKVLVIDLGSDANRANDWVLGSFASIMPATTTWPTERMIQHRGHRTQQGQTSGGYFSTFISVGGEPQRKGAAKGPGHVVFVLRDGAAVPRLALALQAQGRATIVATRKPSEADVATTVEIAAAGGVAAQVRIGELEWGPITADVVVAAGKDPRAAALTAARAAIGKRASPRRKTAAPALPPMVVRDDEDFAATPYPSRELRMLAAIRIWAVLDEFFPYRYLVTDWDGALRSGLAAAEAATDVEGYRLALREMAAKARDGHVNVFPADRGAGAKPRGTPPFEIRIVDGKLAVTHILDAAAAGKLGVAAGDVIETVDGRPALELLAEKARAFGASTDEARLQGVAGSALVGDDGSTVKLGVRGASGPRRDVTATRALANLRLIWQPPPAPKWKLLPGDIGYVDLRTLDVPEVPAMFAAMAKTKAIVFDMRGYPNGTAWAIAPRINVKKATHGAMFLQPLRTGEIGQLDDERVRFMQKIPELPPGAEIYTGKIVVLIDDRAVSQSEHSCLFYQETAGAIFVGSPTAGANGDVTVARLPGGLRISFTGQEVRHVDGKQLQQLGIQPHVRVRPTLAGLRAGKDEVLERALVRIKTGK